MRSLIFLRNSIPTVVAQMPLSSKVLEKLVCYGQITDEARLMANIVFHHVPIAL